MLNRRDFLKRLSGTALGVAFGRLAPGAPSQMADSETPGARDMAQFVGPDGNDDNDGRSPGTAKRTIRAAMDGVAEGGLVVAATGTIYAGGDFSSIGNGWQCRCWLDAAGQPKAATAMRSDE
jgi:hypothetical protein